MRTRLPLDNISPSALKALDPEQILQHLDPLLRRKSRTVWIAGLDEDDLYQEFALVAWKCSQDYNPKPGFRGRQSSFLTYLAHALDNQAIKLAGKQNRRHREAVGLICKACGEQKPVMRKGACVCGRNTWKPLWGQSIQPFVSPANDADEQIVHEPATYDYHAIEDAEPLALVWSVLKPEDKQAFIQALDSGKLRTDIRAYVSVRLAEMWRVYSRRRSTVASQIASYGSGEKNNDGMG